MTAEPDPRCPRHMEEPSPFPCGACGDAREHRAEWQRQQGYEQRQARQREANERSRLRRMEIDRCAICDHDGYVGAVLCIHDPEAPERAARGAAKCRAVLA